MAEIEREEFEVQVKEVPSLMVALVECIGPYEEVGRLLTDLFRWVLIHGGKVASYPMAIFPDGAEREPGEGTEYQVCIPLDMSSTVAGDRDVKIRELPAANVAAARHEGSYSGIGDTYEKLLSWIQENGYEATGPARELYLTNPSQHADDDLLTEVQMVVVDKRH